jgi:hypothetical protein
MNDEKNRLRFRDAHQINYYRNLPIIVIKEQGRGPLPFPIVCFRIFFFYQTPHNPLGGVKQPLPNW